MRLIPRPEPWPPQIGVAGSAQSTIAGQLDPEQVAVDVDVHVEVLEPEWIEGSELVPQLNQMEALQDWYGRIGDDGSFPIFPDRGNWRNHLRYCACCRAVLIFLLGGM